MKSTAQCKVCGSVLIVQTQFLAFDVLYIFPGTTYKGHRVVAPGHWGYNYYFVHETERGIIRLTRLPKSIIPDEYKGELRQ